MKEDGMTRLAASTIQSQTFSLLVKQKSYDVVLKLELDSLQLVKALRSTAACTRADFSYRPQ